MKGLDWMLPMAALLLVAATCWAQLPEEDEEEGVVEHVMVVIGRRAELPCDISPPALDSLYLVLWYKNDSDFPICKYDARMNSDSYAHGGHVMARPAAESEHGRSPAHPSRFHFKSNSHPAVLAISHVDESDQGVYRCRVDFGRSPTRNVLVNLSVIVPPQKIRIIEDDREVTSVVGPYDQGSSLSLNCIVIGGRPRPQVTWWIEDSLVDQTYKRTSDNVVQNVLIIGRLERSHLHARLRCEARNSNLTQPIVSSVQVDLNLKPLAVKIHGADKPLSAGRTYDIECTAAGSRPAANIHWYMHEAQQPAREKVTMDGNITTSIWRLTPTWRDHDALVICNAVNPSLANISASVENRTRLNVHYAPTVELELGRNLNPDSIREGNDVYFECRIHANPPPSRVIWTHEGMTIRENVSAGIIIVDQGLVIRRVSRHQSGRYSCTAVNNEGNGSSNTVLLKVMHRPTCRGGQKTMYGVSKHETLSIRCAADALPRPTVYRWAFNASTAEIIELSTQKYIPEVDGSKVSYSPQADRDYGSLLCWARNEIGEQLEPCVFYVFQGVRPDPPTNCTVLNQTADVVEVWCRPSFDGGHPQQFQLEILDSHSGLLLYNKSGHYPHFRVGNLEPGLKLFLQISAFNVRGRSALVLLEAYTIQPAEKQTVIMETTDFVSLLGITSGVSATLVLICIAIGLTARFRQRSDGQNRSASASGVPPGAPIPSAATSLTAADWSKKANGDRCRRPATHRNAGTDSKIDDGDDENDDPDVIPERNNASRLTQEAGRLTPTHADPLSAAADRLDGDDTPNGRRTAHRTQPNNNNQCRPAYHSSTVNRSGATMASTNHRHADYRYHAVGTPPQTPPPHDDRWGRRQSPLGSPPQPVGHSTPPTGYSSAAWTNGAPVHYYQTLPHKMFIGAPPASRNPLEVVTRKTPASDDPETSI